MDGEKLGPGTYWLRVRAQDRAGNVTEERAALACVRPVKARIITSLPAAGNEVALTFDGGSGYAWRSQMNALHSRDALGTWFCTGVSVDRYPEMARLAVEQHQTIGNHSYDHPDFSSISYEEQVQPAQAQLRRLVGDLPGDPPAVLQAACTGRRPRPRSRPPATPATATSSCGTATPATGRGLSASQVAANALAAAKPGAIIVFHTQWNSDAALPAILKGLEKKGLKAVSLAQLCADAGLPY